jgi:hypothetical protein
MWYVCYHPNELRTQVMLHAVTKNFSVCFGTIAWKPLCIDQLHKQNATLNWSSGRRSSQSLIWSSENLKNAFPYLWNFLRNPQYHHLKVTWQCVLVITIRALLTKHQILTIIKRHTNLVWPWLRKCQTLTAITHGSDKLLRLTHWLQQLLTVGPDKYPHKASSKNSAHLVSVSLTWFLLHFEKKQTWSSSFMTLED